MLQRRSGVQSVTGGADRIAKRRAGASPSHSPCALTRQFRSAAISVHLFGPSVSRQGVATSTRDVRHVIAPDPLFEHSYNAAHSRGELQSGCVRFVGRDFICVQAHSKPDLVSDASPSSAGILGRMFSWSAQWRRTCISVAVFVAISIVIPIVVCVLTRRALISRRSLRSCRPGRWCGGASADQQH